MFEITWYKKREAPPKLELFLWWPTFEFTIHLKNSSLEIIWQKRSGNHRTVIKFIGERSSFGKPHFLFVDIYNALGTWIRTDPELLCQLLTTYLVPFFTILYALILSTALNYFIKLRKCSVLASRGLKDKQVWNFFKNIAETE